MVPYPKIFLRVPINPPPSIIIFAFINPIPSTYHSVTLFLASEEPSTTDSNFIASNVPALVITDSLLRAFPVTFTLQVTPSEYSSPSHLSEEPSTTDSNFIASNVPALVITDSLLRAFPVTFTLQVTPSEYSSPSHSQAIPGDNGRGNRNKGLLYVNVPSFFINRNIFKS